MKFLLITISICLLLLSSCGFKSVYSDKDISQFNSIEIEPILSIAGAELYYQLSNIMPKKVTAKYLLKIKISYATTPVVIKKDSDVLRDTVNQVIEYSLYDIETNKQLTAGKFKQLSSYNTTFSAYASYIERESALESLTRYAAEELHMRLILYFENQKL